MKWFNAWNLSIRTRSMWSAKLQLGVAVGGVLLFTAGAHSGNLMPPAGPVASTMKTLAEIEPRIAINAANTPGDADGSPSLFKITQRGSYYLTSNITGVAGKNGIEIVASGVTLDLNGFDLLGVAGSLDGVGVSVADLTNLAVVNGSARSWGWRGVNLAGFGSVNCRVEGVLASGNALGGILVGVDSTVTNCAATSNTFGIVAAQGSTVTNCSAYNNTGDGILAGDGSTVISCAASGNIGGSGIRTANGGTISHCSASGNTGSGIFAGAGSTVTHCSANENTSNGILTDAGSTIADCSVRLNTLDGIFCTEDCVIRGNTCSFNGNSGDGAGIHAIGFGNRIEGNNCTRADRGIDVDGTGNIIIKNTCAINITNWTIVANNVVGPILDRRAPASAAINGNSAPSSLGSTDPNANFTY